MPQKEPETPVKLEVFVPQKEPLEPQKDFGAQISWLDVKQKSGKSKIKHYKKSISRKAHLCVTFRLEFFGIQKIIVR